MIEGMSVAARLLSLLATTATFFAGGSTAASETAARPTKAEIEAKSRVAVRASRATVVRLIVVPPNQRYVLTIRVSDPARYLERRVNPVVEVVNRMTNVQWLFRSRYFAVVDSTGTAVFRVRHTRSGSRETLDWFVKPALADCARNIDFNVEIDPDNAAPPCPT